MSIIIVIWWPIEGVSVLSNTLNRMFSVFYCFVFYTNTAVGFSNLFIKLIYRYFRLYLMLDEIRFELNRSISIASNEFGIFTFVSGIPTIIMSGNQFQFLFGFVTFALSIHLDNSISKRSNIIRIIIIIQLLTIDGNDDYSQCLQYHREKKTV